MMRSAPLRKASLHLACGTLAVSLALMPACAPRKNANPQAAATQAPTTQPADPSLVPLDHDGWRSVGYRPEWITVPFPGSTTRNRVVQTLPGDDVIITQMDDSTVSAIEVGTGRRRWSTDLTGPLTKFVGLARDPAEPSRLLVASESELFVMAVATSNLLVRERFDRIAGTSPVVAGDLAFMGSAAGELFAHVIGRGIKRWGFATRGGIEVQPVPVADTIAAVTSGGEIVFLTAEGSLRGRASLLAAPSTNPVTDGTRLFVASRDRSVWAFDPSGRQLWRVRTDSPLTVQPAVINNVLYVEVPGSGLLALDAATGKSLWQNSGVRGTAIGVRNGRLLVLGPDSLVLVDPARGDEIARVATTGLGPILAHGGENPTLYAFSKNLRLVKLVPTP